VLAVISNIHGNARALWPVLSYLSNNGINEIYCLGDILGYGPFPNECWEKIVKRTQFVVGDFELAMLDEEYTKGKNWTDTALKSLAWQREIFKYKSELESYRSKIKLRVGNIIFTHADLTRPYEFIDLENRGRRDKLIEENLEEMKRQNIKICFVGHTGKPFFAGRKSDNTLFIDDHIKNQSYEIKDYVQVLINVGSIGFPQDGNKESCFVVCNRLENKVFFIRNDYLNKDVFKDFAKVIKDNKFDEKTARSILDTLNTGI